MLASERYQVYSHIRERKREKQERELTNGRILPAREAHHKRKATRKLCLQGVKAAGRLRPRRHCVIAGAIGRRSAAAVESSGNNQDIKQGNLSVLPGCVKRGTEAATELLELFSGFLMPVVPPK